MVVGFDAPWILSGILFIPYLIWGVYTLQLRLARHHELPLNVQLITLGCVVLFYIFEYVLLKSWLGHTPLLFVLAMFALFLSGMALYGHILLAMGSGAFLDVMAPGQKEVREPNYSAGEAREQNGDYEGAIREYLAVARQFPQDSKAALRVADNYMKLERHKEAAPWFEKGLAGTNGAHQSLPVTNRLYELYRYRLHKEEEAKRVLEMYLKKYPVSEYAPSVQARLDRLIAGIPSTFEEQ